jgi:hypothetical protein
LIEFGYNISGLDVNTIS